MAIVISLKGSINTDFVGIQKLYRFYEDAKSYFDNTIHINFYELKFLDGNLCALFHSMLHKLHISNRLFFETDYTFIRTKFDVLARNGFIPNLDIQDDQKSTVALHQFSSSNFDDYISYIENELLNHRGMTLSSTDQDKILDCFIEIFSNIEIHSKTDEPFFACGQYFPQEKMLKFTIVDLGVGFLPAIQHKTGGKISKHEEAIVWALKNRNSTKADAPGGLGLTTLQNHFQINGGGMQIVTGDAYWVMSSTTNIGRYKKFTSHGFGSMINLLFSYK